MIDTGISVYVGLADYKLEDNLKYLRMAKEKGIEYVFSSAHINEANLTLQELQIIIDECNKLGLKLSIDVSNESMKLIDGINKLYCLRLDYGFSDEEIVRMSKEEEYYLELNASTIKKERLEKLINLGLNVKKVRLSFNFYPKLFTGHDIETVKDKTRMFKEMGFYVSAFIPTLVNHRPPLYEGLPTVEKHRKQDLDLSIEELKAIGINGIYFGDAFATVSEMEQLNNHRCEELIVFVDKYQNLPNLSLDFEKIYQIRPDYNNYLLRFSSSRLNSEIGKFNTVIRMKYDLTMDNDLFKRYRGEINICLQDMPLDERVNVIGHCLLSDVIIDKLKDGKKFKLKLKEE